MESKREIIMEKENLISPVMVKYRQTVQKYASLFGQMLFTVVTTNPDLKWKEDCLNNKQTLRNDVKVCIIKAIDISGIELLGKDVDGSPKIVLNPKSGDNNLVFPLVEPEFTKATRENVIECIERACKPGSKPMFFSADDLKTLTELVNSANQSALNQYEEQARKMMALSETVRDMMKNTKRMYSDYRSQCGIEDNDTVVEISATVEK